MHKELPQPHWWQRAAQAVAYSRYGSRLAARLLPRVDRTVLRLSGNRFTFSSALSHVPVVMLTTTGAKSGLPRTVPLLAFPDGDKVVLIASSFGNSKHPAWYLNLRANPQATLAFHGQPARPYVAREASGAERDACWQRAAAAYPGYDSYEKRAEGREIPVLVLEPAAPGEFHSSAGSAPAPQDLADNIPSA
jgi:deazaflavin-dependent oxidoreductase (nitroreductase family)